MTKKEKKKPSLAPGMNMHDKIEEKAAEADVKKEATTPVQRLYLDRTPED